ncbi:MAG: HDOD domain-containing protein [Deltaproteobacteria bacterium]|nr:HDOD domain-containing protein [Deltaproteobacteria bacterium]
MNILSKDELVQLAGDLQVLPDVARKVIDTISSESGSASQLSSVIEKDQSIAARVLKISNSALYCSRQEVTSLQQAVITLGGNAIKNIALAVSTKSLYKYSGIAEHMMWDHAIGVAIAARLIAADHGRELAEVAFIGGLMHDVGKVVMNNEAHEAFIEVMKSSYNNGVDSLDAENAVFGYNHIDVGSKVVEKWGFPSNLVQILARHHLNKCSLEDISDPLVAKATASVALADSICKQLGIGYRNQDDTVVIHMHPSVAFLHLSKDKVDKLIEETGTVYQQEKALFQ